MPTWNQETYIKAWKFAARAHLGQTVPGSDIPYLFHIGLVAAEAMGAATCEAVDSPDLLVTCAVLHDVIEDTPSTYEDMRAAFGTQVADGVLALSKQKALPTKEAQMKDSLDRIRQQPGEIWMVKLCDRITNLLPPPAHWDRTKIQQYRDEAGLILETLGGASPYLSKRMARKIKNYG
ncbi:MAG: HD domain-containing protein [Desulfobacterales bacterium]|nr:HD domain-containing protein [Desulfobacterales bacterium]